LNRLAQKAYSDSTAVNYTSIFSQQDSGLKKRDSRLTQVSDPTGTYQFTFDNMGRLTQATTTYNFLTGRNSTTSYSYDAASNRTGFTDPENGATSYVYDTLNSRIRFSAAILKGEVGFTHDKTSAARSVGHGRCNVLLGGMR